jgi:hypothetical protein
MKSLLIFTLALVFLIPLARTVYAAPAANPGSAETTRLLFKGTLQSKETYSTVFPTMYVTSNGSADATHLGTFTVSYHIEQSLHDLSQTVSIQFAGANGNGIQAKGMGQAIEDRTPGMYNVLEVYTITGGSGYFTGASGTFTMKRLVSISAGLASGTFEGYILLPAN